MKIGINAYPLSREFSGTSVYLFNLIKYLEIYGRKNEYFIYSRPGIKLPFKQNPNWHIVTVDGFLNRSSTFWMMTSAKRQILKDRLDIFWATENILPLDLPKEVKKILTVYDLVWYYYPKVLNIDNFFILPLFADRSIRNADYIFTISNHIAEDIKAIFNIGFKNISVIYLGINSEFQPLNKNDSADFIANKYGVSNKYILFVSNIEPKKNVANLLKAFYTLKNKYNVQQQLLLAGGKRWNDFSIYRTYKELKFSNSQVKFLGYVDFKDLPKLYSGAEVFILPSIYEGFGLPSLESMACGTPTIVSDIPVFREILGDAALFTSPYNPEGIANGIYRVLTDKTLAEELIQKGLERVKLFSWEESAKRILELFEEMGSIKC